MHCLQDDGVVITSHFIFVYIKKIALAQAATSTPRPCTKYCRFNSNERVCSIWKHLRTMEAIGSRCEAKPPTLKRHSPGGGIVLTFIVHMILFSHQYQFP